MKKLLLFFILLFVVPVACKLNVQAAITVLSSVNKQFSTGTNTTSNINTTGATLIVCVFTYRTAQSSDFSDSQGNTWTLCTRYDGGSGNVSGITVYYCVNPSTSATHNFTTTVANFGAMSVFAMSGTRTSSPKDQENGFYQPSLGTTLNPGSITPTANGCIVFTGCMNWNGTAPTMPSGYTGFTWTTGTAYAGGAGYKIQTTAGAENPTWANMNSGSNGSANVISFFAPASAPTAQGAFFWNMIK